MATPTRLTDTAVVDDLIARSHEHPILVFKHSLICPISSAAYAEYGKFIDAMAADSPVELTLIEIQRARDVSNRVAEATGVRHESPQALLFRDGEVVWHASHRKISKQSLEQAVADH
ncbi:MAG: bacillithiol system redox-active protein YtxJ [Acidobacteriota bacterium]